MNTYSVNDVQFNYILFFISSFYCMFKKYLPTLMMIFSCIILLYFFYKLPQLLYLGWYKVRGQGLFVFSV